jgi:hypothetical protein
MIEVSLTELISEVVSGLRQIAGLSEEHLNIEPPAADALIGLDHAIALALYFAVLLPPYLDEAITRDGSVTIATDGGANMTILSVRGSWGVPVPLDLLRNRLMQAYAAQLKAEIVSASPRNPEQLRFVVDRAQAAKSIG